MLCCHVLDKHSKHAHLHAEDGESALKITFDKPLEKARFIEKLNSIPQSICRIKGVVKFVGSKDACFVQNVNG